MASDEQIRNEIDRAWSNFEIDVSSIVVQVEDGHVTLDGTVDTYSKKVAVESAVVDVEGVKELTSKVAVVPTEDIADAAIADTIIDALSRHAGIDVDDLDLRVENGRVTLSGILPSPEIEDAIFEVVLYTVGVRSIENNLAIEGQEA